MKALGIILIIASVVFIFIAAKEIYVKYPHEMPALFAGRFIVLGVGLLIAGIILPGYKKEKKPERENTKTI